MNFHSVSNGIFWFAVAGAGAASLKHFFNPSKSLKELTPVSFSDNGKLEPASLFWGSYAFSAMNLGYCTVGLWAGYTGSWEAKQAVLLGTGVLFEAFSIAWFTNGQITLKKDYKRQGTKVGLFGLLFLSGFAMSLL
jgi:hypothetical protein